MTIKSRYPVFTYANMLLLSDTTQSSDKTIWNTVIAMSTCLSTCRNYSIFWPDIGTEIHDLCSIPKYIVLVYSIYSCEYDLVDVNPNSLVLPISHGTRNIHCAVLPNMLEGLYLMWTRWITSMKAWLSRRWTISSDWMMNSLDTTSPWEVALDCRAPNCRTQRYRKSFVPNSVHIMNS